MLDPNMVMLDPNMVMLDPNMVTIWLGDLWVQWPDILHLANGALGLRDIIRECLETAAHGECQNFR